MRAPLPDPESARLHEDAERIKNWKRWGPYLSERQWSTVREDYSPDGNVWEYFPHDHARSRAYRWGEDGLLGICDRQCRLCFALALWNGRDPILKERLFGLTGPQGNHGEDVKEHYFYLDSTPTHSYMRALYKYPHAEFPYAALVEENERRGRDQPEFELADTGVFEGGRYFDVQAEYAKAGPEDILIRVTATNHAPEPADLHVLPSLWFRNRWSWGRSHEDGEEAKPCISAPARARLRAEHPTLGTYVLCFEPGPDGTPPECLFTENETNLQRLYGAPNPTPFVKDAFHERLIKGNPGGVNPELTGTKAAPWYRLTLPARGQASIRLRLTAEAEATRMPFGKEFDRILDDRKREGDEYLASRLPSDPERRNIARQAYAGLLWSKQFYHYVVPYWLSGDPAQPPPPEPRKSGRNSDWRHLYSRDVLSMPDKWEYPWFAAWDLAFHMAPMARIDPHFAKEQLMLLLREWYMHPSGQIPAYEFAFGDVNPPVHAWACLRVYKMTAPRGQRDTVFLARAFQKLLLNFTWWVNRKDPAGKHLFSGGFLGLDNIGVFDRSRPLPVGGHLEQADGTAWMAFYCGAMLAIALELAKTDPAYEDMASKFFEHFVAITDAMNTLGGTGLWHEEDGFYYDQVNVDGRAYPVRLRSLVGLVPLLAVLAIEDETIEQLPGFRHRMEWFLRNRTDLARHITYMQHAGECPRRLLAIPSRERLLRVLRYLFDESEFLSPFGIRSLSKVYEKNPYVINIRGQEFRVDYTPGESTTSLFGGNSNWRGPIWFPLNYLLIDALERYDYCYGESLKVECPTGSGRPITLKETANEIRRRLARLFLPDSAGRRPAHLGDRLLCTDRECRDLVLFHEHFHAETGRGLGATHQTGWTALIAELLRNPPA